MGGGTYSRASPFGCWAQDVQALGFLRPPWGLAFDALLETTWPVTSGDQRLPSSV